MLGEVVGLVEGEMGSLEVRLTKGCFALFLFNTFHCSGGWWEAADRTAFQQHLAAHASEEGCGQLQSLPGDEVLVWGSRWKGSYSLSPVGCFLPLSTSWKGCPMIVGFSCMTVFAMWSLENVEIFIYLSLTDKYVLLKSAWNIPAAF